MNIIFLTIPLALILATFFVIAFIIAVKVGQFDDLETPAYKLLLEEKNNLKSKEQSDE